jgi:2-keto-3-deoxy-L-rhamnonate aldolase RhmA
VTAISGAPAEAWIRVAHNDATLIKLALDTGAQEIVVPMVMTAAEAEQAVSASKYPPAIPTPFDLAVNMGFSDGPGHPEVQGALAQAWQKIADKGLRLSSFVVTPEQGRAALDRGVQLLFLGFDTMFIPGAIDNYLRLLNPST